MQIIDWNNCHTPEQLDSIGTTKNDLADDKTFYEQIVEYCNEHFLVLVEKDVWEDAKKALTTKNDLGVDCISRADAIRVASGYCHPSNVAKELAKLPSVTPQEPILDKIRAEIIEDCGYSKDYVGAFTYSTIRLKTVLRIIDKYKAESEGI